MNVLEAINNNAVYMMCCVVLGPNGSRTRVSVYPFYLPDEPVHPIPLFRMKREGSLQLHVRPLEDFLRSCSLWCWSAAVCRHNGRLRLSASTQSPTCQPRRINPAAWRRMFRKRRRPQGAFFGAGTEPVADEGLALPGAVGGVTVEGAAAGGVLDPAGAVALEEG